MENKYIIALAGNPNVGKSTVFNSLTGLNQHTGNWTGKTVSNAFGTYIHQDTEYTLVDLPGTYSLLSSSEEEEEARNFILCEKPNAVVVVLDGTCLERNLNLAIQILEITKNVIICVNLLDEAKKKKIIIDLDELSLQLGVPVVGTSARNGKGLDELKNKIAEVVFKKKKTFGVKIEYNSQIEESIHQVEQSLEFFVNDKKLLRFYSLKLLDDDKSISEKIFEINNIGLSDQKKILRCAEKTRHKLYEECITTDILRDIIVSAIILKCEDIYSKTVTLLNPAYNSRDRKIDKILTSKATGIPIMILLLGVIFWITITGANYPSALLSQLFSFIGNQFTRLLTSINTPEIITDILVNGIYNTTAWVVAVMLPPMAIFFPLFTLLEDLGYLPRIAFNMDKFFKKANAHGKQALTMCIEYINL